MTVQSLKAQITDRDHPLEGAEVVMTWDDLNPSEIDVHVRVADPNERFPRWVPVQLVDHSDGPDPDEAA